MSCSTQECTWSCIQPILCRSPLRPHCRAKDHIRLWLPIPNPSRADYSATLHHSASLSEEWLNCILDVIAASWTEKTKETYRAGLLVFHVYCDLNLVPNSRHSPIAQPLLSVFLTSCVGAYSGSTLSNFVARLRAWHILHGQPWLANHDELRSILEGASRLAPKASKRPKRILLK